MSIYNLPPLTQTFEQPEVHENDGMVINLVHRLGAYGTRQSFEESASRDTRPLYLPTHAALQEGIDRVHMVGFVEIETRRIAICEKMQRVATEIAAQQANLAATEEYLDDLGLDPQRYSNKSFNGRSRQDILYVLQALGELERELAVEHDAVITEQLDEMSHLEKLEQMDFDLYQAGE